MERLSVHFKNAPFASVAYEEVSLSVLPPELGIQSPTTIWEKEDTCCVKRHRYSHFTHRPESKVLPGSHFCLFLVRQLIMDALSSGDFEQFDTP